MLVFVPPQPQIEYIKSILSSKDWWLHLVNIFNNLCHCPTNCHSICNVHYEGVVCRTVNWSILTTFFSRWSYQLDTPTDNWANLLNSNYDDLLFLTHKDLFITQKILIFCNSKLIIIFYLRPNTPIYIQKFKVINIFLWSKMSLELDYRCIRDSFLSKHEYTQQKPNYKMSCLQSVLQCNSL